MKKMVFTQEAYDEIMRTVATLPAETGGILLGNRDDFVVQKFIFDDSGSRGPTSYDPDIGSLNKKIKYEWEENQLALLGFIHSHPRGYAQLSGDMGNGIGDIGYIKEIFKYIEALDKFLVPIVFSKADRGKYEMFPFMARRDNEDNYETLSLKIIDKYEKKSNIANSNTQEKKSDVKKTTQKEKGGRNVTQKHAET